MEKILESMSSNKVPNYIAPGLESYLLGRENSKVRMFRMTRDHELYISPHSHRFDFFCIVVRGSVRQHLYEQVSGPNKYASEYNEYEYVPNKQFGKEFTRKLLNPNVHFLRDTTEYKAGEFYGMVSREYHSIEFSRDAVVLFFEGPMLQSTSNFLEPVVDGKETSIFTIPDWMYS